MDRFTVRLEEPSPGVAEKPGLRGGDRYALGRGQTGRRSRREVVLRAQIQQSPAYALLHSIEVRTWKLLNQSYVMTA